MRDPVDWEALARALGAVTPRGELGGSNLARDALSAILGPEELQRAVDWYVAGDVGGELARSVLWLLHPREAMDRCRAIWASASSPPDDRRRAIELLRVVGDASILPWVPALLDDDDEVVRDLAIQIVDQLVFSSLADAEDVADVLQRAEAHADPTVRERAGAIREQLARRG
ncbi:MAG: HEAT repeat domain-containing protein [Myxococcota bacterium]